MLFATGYLSMAALTVTATVSNSTFANLNQAFGQTTREDWSNRQFAGYIQINWGAVPEPSIIALFAAGLIAIGFARRRKA